MYVLTLFEVTKRAIPSGINARPMAKKAGKTVLAVRIGCHAGSFCCLNLVSKQNKQGWLMTYKNRNLKSLVPNSAQVCFCVFKNYFLVLWNLKITFGLLNYTELICLLIKITECISCS